MEFIFTHFFINSLHPCTYCIAPASNWDENATILSRAINCCRHLRKHATPNSSLMEHVYSNASRTVTPHRPMGCAWAFVTPRRPHADDTHSRAERTEQQNTHATTQHHSQGCNFPIHFPNSLNPPLASVIFWFEEIETWLEGAPDRTDYPTTQCASLTAFFFEYRYSVWLSFLKV